MSENPNYFAIIPASVRYDSSVSPSSKLLYAEISSLCNSRGFCFATDDYFSKLYGTTKSSVQRWLVELESKKYIRREIVYKQGTKEILDRHIYILDPLYSGMRIPMLKNENTPIIKNEGDNNKYINNNPPIIPQRDDGCLDFNEFKSRWNRNAEKHDNFVAINLMSDPRKKKLLQRMKDLKSNGIEPTIDNFFKTVGKAYMNSSFLRGEKTNFNFTLDFVLQASSFQKLLEGGYEDCQ